ncbi:MAG: hypothetical protein AABX89_07095 [Candidatus Thermoplasmatota archaeon]
MASKKASKSSAGTAAKSRPKPQPVARSRAKPAAPAASGQRDFLVVFEEPDPYGLPSEDALILDIESSSNRRGQVDVQQKLALQLTNTTSRLGTFGFILSSLGALMGLLLLLTFVLVYPQDWYTAEGAVQTTAIVKSLILLAILDVLLLVGGTVLTHYGRRIQARGALSDVRLVERTAVPSARFE